MEHIQPICSRESKLCFDYICSIRIRSRNEDIFEFITSSIVVVFFSTMLGQNPPTAQNRGGRSTGRSGGSGWGNGGGPGGSGGGGKNVRGMKDVK